MCAEVASGRLIPFWASADPVLADLQAEESGVAVPWNSLSLTVFQSGKSSSWPAWACTELLGPSLSSEENVLGFGKGVFAFCLWWCLVFCHPELLFLLQFPSSQRSLMSCPLFAAPLWHIWPHCWVIALSGRGGGAVWTYALLTATWLEVFQLLPCGMWVRLDRQGEGFCQLATIKGIPSLLHSWCFSCSASSLHLLWAPGSILNETNVLFCLPFFLVLFWSAVLLLQTALLVMEKASKGESVFVCLDAAFPECSFVLYAVLLIIISIICPSKKTLLKTSVDFQETVTQSTGLQF